MVCLMKYEHSFIEKITHEPIIKKISFYSAIPLFNFTRSTYKNLYK